MVAWGTEVSAQQGEKQRRESYEKPDRKVRHSMVESRGKNFCVAGRGREGSRVEKRPVARDSGKSLQKQRIESKIAWT